MSDHVCDGASLIGIKTRLERRVLVTSRRITIACKGALSPSKIRCLSLFRLLERARSEERIPSNSAKPVESNREWGVTTAQSK